MLIAANTGSGVLGRCCAPLWGSFTAPLAASTLPGGDRAGSASCQTTANLLPVTLGPFLGQNLGRIWSTKSLLAWWTMEKRRRAPKSELSRRAETQHLSWLGLDYGSAGIFYFAPRSLIFRAQSSHIPSNRANPLAGDPIRTNGAMRAPDAL